MTRDERNPIERASDLPVPEVGDYASFGDEPDHGDPEAREPELERLDLAADEPPEVDPADPLGPPDTAARYSTE